MANTTSPHTPLLGNLRRQHTGTFATLNSLAKVRQTADVHKERHSKIGEYLGDAILGFADGLTVPFALTAGLSAYVYKISISQLLC